MAGVANPAHHREAHGAARIVKIDGRYFEGFRRGEVAVVAGFQGLHASEPGDDARAGGSNLRRGARRGDRRRPLRHLHRRRRRLYTDPRVVPKARRLNKVSLEEMLEMASLGAKVLQERSVEVALLHKVRLYVRSSSTIPPPQAWHAHLRRGGNRGTAGRHRHRLLADEVQITLREVADKPGVAAAIFGPLAEANINVDMIIQVVSEDKTTTDITFTVPPADFERARRILETRREAIGYAS